MESSLKVFLGTVFTLVSISNMYSQTTGIHLGATISPAYVSTKVVDNDGRSSEDHYVADGVTEQVSNQRASNLRLNVSLELDDNIRVESGLWISAKQMHIRNTDGDYSGTSNYEMTYVQIPVHINVALAELTPELHLFLKAGPTLEMKTAEELEGGDGAHYWNLANNRTDIDPSRGTNGNGKAVDLFNNFDLSAYIGVGVRYKISDKFEALGSLSYAYGFNDIVNRRLLFNDSESTKVTDDIDWRLRMTSLDLGIVYQLN